MPDQPQVQPGPAYNRVLDARESALVDHALAALDARPAPQAEAGRQDLEDGLRRLLALWDAIELFPRTQESQRLGWRTRNLDTLLARFAATDAFAVEAALPTRAALARAFGMAKFNFTRLVRYVLLDQLGPLDAHRALLAEVEAVERSAVAAIIAEDVLRSIAADMGQAPPLRRRATTVLSALWDQRATRGIADFAPLLDLAWRAKASVTITYGTLQGVSELFQLMAHGCPPELVESFSCPRVESGTAPSQEGAAAQDRFHAFEEFVFNATHEELARMRGLLATREASALGNQDIAALFGVPLDRLHTTTTTAKDMFFTFREREMWARHRQLTALSGPKKTAEEYVMITVLEHAEP